MTQWCNDMILKIFTNSWCIFYHWNPKFFKSWLRTYARKHKNLRGVVSTTTTYNLFWYIYSVLSIIFIVYYTSTTIFLKYNTFHMSMTYYREIFPFSDRVDISGCWTLPLAISLVYLIHSKSGVVSCVEIITHGKSRIFTCIYKAFRKYIWIS